MTRPTRWCVLLLFWAAAGWCQGNERWPHIGYFYPSGGQVGATLQVTVGGQYLQGVDACHFSGDGVTAKVVEWARPISPVQRGDINRFIRQIQSARRLAGQGRAAQAQAELEELPELPDHPWIRGLRDMSDAEQNEIRDKLNNPKLQLNAQIGELVILEVAIAPNALPGDREVRLETPTGLTNPMCFQIGVWPEFSEVEPMAGQPYPMPVLDVPVVINGQIMPGDIDYFKIRARAGQQLVIECAARHLIPYLADAVPGWFQATMSLYDTSGNEIAFVDDYGFRPDPVLFANITRNGEFVLQIRDSIYRGREDFVYRISVAERPFIYRMFPLGGQVGVQAVASIEGWNLPSEQVVLDTSPTSLGLRETFIDLGHTVSNSIWYAVDTLPECIENEPNDTPAEAHKLHATGIVNGTIGAPGDIDYFEVRGKAGEELVAEVTARRLYSPVDSLLRILDASGKVLDWNDDKYDTEIGLLTHHADSYLRVKLPADGTYYVQMSEAQWQGGDAYAYRLRIGAPQPDFALRAVPSSLTVPAGRVTPVLVHVFRKDGYAGEIELSLKDAPAGFALSGNRVPPGADKVRMTLAAPVKQPERPVPLKLEGRAVIEGREVVREVVPAEDQMQAFLWRHLVPAKELLCSVTRGRGYVSVVGFDKSRPIPIPLGGSAEVKIQAGQKAALKNVTVQLDDPPKGITIASVKATDEGLTVVVKADAEATRVGFADNLVVSASTVQTYEREGRQQSRRVSLGFLPAIPFEVVAR